MKKMVIQETIVVEGKHDVDKIKSCVDADVITTSGTHLSKRTLELIKKTNDNKGIIVFTDPDAPGEMIRTRIIEEIGECKHASLSLSQSKSKGKVGIEHATCEDIIHALKSVATLNPNQQTLSRHEFVDLGLSGRPDSQDKRDALSSYLNIPKTNAKRAFKYLNMMGYNKEKIDNILKELACGNDRK